ncbi:poly(A) RNA polymerase, mitochondrial [Culicoides brevitarsis]|uniref:poly(A) RNA polymerase, mitochondrial n=1 Tax=Culicoides brevitarsis TaxID=469753 RepID=UPI00307B2EB1
MLKIRSKYNLIRNCCNITSIANPVYSDRESCTKSHANDVPKKEFVNFDWMNRQRRDEARRSVLVQVNSEKSFDELQLYCNPIAKIRSAHHYTVAQDSHYILLELESAKEADALLDSCVYNDDSIKQGIPTKSHFLWFRTGPTPKLQPEKPVPLTSLNGNKLVDAELPNFLAAAENVEEQMNIVYESTKVTDLGMRTRYLAAQQIMSSVEGMFPHAIAHPFGSSVNGFGKVGCDLDLVLELKPENDKTDSESRLVFHTKSNSYTVRTQLSSISDILQSILPGVHNVRRILQARVPIVKYKHEYLDLEVDLSMNNLTGAYMSELLYMFGEMDQRVRPLVFCIRRWAKSAGLTNPQAPGRWITNFSLTMLVIFFLQSHKNPVLPSINYLKTNARPCDTRITENINCTFLRDLNLMKFKTNNSQSIEDLLLDFFQFYSTFDFSKRGISLTEGEDITKPDHSAMHIVNPLEPELNISKNVSLEEMGRFCIECRNAVWILESDQEREMKKGPVQPWGLMKLFKLNQSVNQPKIFIQPRLVQIADLFEEEENVPYVRRNYKNETTRKTIEEIKKKNKKDLTEIGKRFNQPRQR